MRKQQISIFLPQLKKTLYSDAGSNLMQILLKYEIPVASSCAGEGLCQKCLVYISKKREQTGLAQLSNPPRVFSEEKVPFLSCQYEVIEEISVSTNYWGQIP